MSFSTLNDVTAKMARVREDARMRAVESMRRMEEELVSALGGEKLLGLPNLATSKLPWRGARVRGAIGKRLSTQYFGKGGGWSRPVLCVDETGHLVMVRRSRSGEISARRVMDDELVAEDLDHLARALPAIVALHVERAKARHQSFTELRDLATRIEKALNEDGEDE